jgi:hypothetical protein
MADKNQAGLARRAISRIKPPPHSPDPPTDLVLLAKAKRELQRTAFREIVTLSPVIASVLLLINLTANFGGEFNIVIAILNYISLSTAALALTASLAVVATIFALVVIPSVVGDSRYSSRIRRAFLLAFALMVFTTLFILPFIISIGLPLFVFLLWLGLRHNKREVSPPISFQQWLDSPEPSDIRLLELWQQGRELRKRPVQAEQKKTFLWLRRYRKPKSSEDPIDHVAQVQRRTVERMREISDANRPTWREEIVRYAPIAAFASVAFAAVLPPQIGPRVEVTLEDGTTSIVYVLDGKNSETLLIDASTHAPRIVPSPSIRRVRYCTADSPFLQRPLRSGVNANRWLKDPNASVVNCPLPVPQ